MIEYLIIGGGILFGLIGFIIGSILVARSYRESPSISHYKRIVDILTLRKLWSKKAIPQDIITDKSKDHIKHYEDMRDKMTLRKKTELPGEGGGRSLLGIIPNLIGSFIAILIGFTLLPEIIKQVNSAQGSQNVISSMTTVLGLVPVFFGMAIIGIAIATIVGALRSAGTI